VCDSSPDLAEGEASGLTGLLADLSQKKRRSHPEDALAAKLLMRKPVAEV
jgi:hypothetical protein